jgi:hypothetical protein
MSYGLVSIVIDSNAKIYEIYVRVNLKIGGTLTFTIECKAPAVLTHFCVTKNFKSIIFFQRK